MTAIEWTDVTWNPIRGCSRVSEGCRHCYAETMATRFSGPGLAYEGLAKNGRWTGKIRFVEEKIDQPLRWRRPRRIFVNSMSDLFHEKVSEGWIARIFGIMAAARRHSFQVLTKRPQRILDWVGSVCATGQVFPWYVRAGGIEPDGSHLMPWPLPNVWLGVSVEDQKTANERIPLLLQTPAAVRWISAEPLLGPVDLEMIWHREGGGPDAGLGLDWVVVGGESGSGARPMHPDWARSLRDQCVAAEVPFLFKQVGAWTSDKPELFVRMSKRKWSHETVCIRPDGHNYRATEPDTLNEHTMLYCVGKKNAGRELDGRTWDQYPETKVPA